MRGAPMAVDWTDEQNDAIVADYFAMLADDIAGRPYNKAAHNRTLAAQIGRPRSSIEFKHRNISAVLQGLGEDWIAGYRPAFNFQASLVDAVVRWLQIHPDWLARTAPLTLSPARSAFREDAILWIGPPPTHSNAPPPNELEQMTAIARNTMSPSATLTIGRSAALARSASSPMNAPTCSERDEPISPNAFAGCRISMAMAPAMTSAASMPREATG
jgi:hypothetical protein